MLSMIYSHIKEFFASSKKFMKLFLIGLQNLLTGVYYDIKLGISTGGISQVKSKGLMKDNSPFQSAPYNVIKRILKKIELENNDVFIDLGCGKARVIAFVAQKKLKKIIGIEIEKDLAQLAKKNMELLKAKKTPVSVINQDAAKAELSEGTVFFFSNPFSYKTLNVVLKKIKASLAKHPRKIRIICTQSYNINLLEEQKWLKKTQLIKGVFLFSSK